jgi:hypothetical protein
MVGRSATMVHATPSKLEDVAGQLARAIDQVRADSSQRTGAAARGRIAPVEPPGRIAPEVLQVAAIQVIDVTAGAVAQQLLRLQQRGAERC